MIEKACVDIFKFHFLVTRSNTAPSSGLLKMDQEELTIDPRTILLLYSRRGDSINKRNADGRTMLHLAVRIRDGELAAVLLNAGADVNIVDNAGNSPFSLAMNTGSPEMVDLLLKYEPDFNNEIVRDQFYTLLSSCLLDTWVDDQKILRSLIRHGFTVKETDITNLSNLWAAIVGGLEDIATSIVNYQRSYTVCLEMWYRSLLLHMQPYTQRLSKILKILIKLIDRFMPGKKIETLGNKNLDLFKILLSEHSAKLIHVNIIYMDKLDDNDETEMITIANNILMSCYDGENPICDEKGRTGLHYAAKVGDGPVIQALLNMNLDINTADVDGKTPIDYINDRINELSREDVSNEILNTQRHFDRDLNCSFTLFDLKMSSVIFIKHVSKLITANYYVSTENLRVMKKLLLMLKEELVTLHYYLSIFSFIEQCEEELYFMKREKLVGLTYYDFLTKNYNQIAPYARRKEVIDAIQTKDDILLQYEVYGPMLRHRLNISSIRRGLIETAETIVFDIMKWVKIPLVVVRQILSNLSNEDLFFIVLNT